MNKFKVGDIVTGLTNYECHGEENPYGITDHKMTKGKVIDLEEEGCIKIEILEHESSAYVGKYFYVREKYFKLVKGEPSKPVEKVEVSANPSGGRIKVIEEVGKTFLIIDKKYTICLEGNFSISILNKDEDVYNEEIGKALAYLRFEQNK